MKKIVLLIICLFLFYSQAPARADDDSFDDSNWGVQPINKNEHPTDKTPSAEKVWNNLRDEKIYENYGSDKSPAFLNRENINPSDDDSGDSNTYDVE